MITEQIDGNSYKVYLYDWLNLHEDYYAGEIKRNPNVSPEDSDDYYWMYYPSDKVSHLMVGDMQSIMEFTNKLNLELNNPQINYSKVKQYTDYVENLKGKGLLKPQPYDVTSI